MVLLLIESPPFALTRFDDDYAPGFCQRDWISWLSGVMTL